MKALNRVVCMKKMVSDFRLNYMIAKKSLNTLSSWSEETILTAFKKNNVSEHKTNYKKEQRRLQNLPTMNVINAIFGCWDNLQKALRGEPYDINDIPVTVKKERSKEEIAKAAKKRLYAKQNRVLLNDPEYQLKTIIKMGLWETEKYKTAHREFPEAVPSYQCLLNQWGKFELAKEAAIRYGFAGRMALFLQFCENLKRIPTSEECRGMGISLQEIKDKFGGSIEKINDLLELSKNGSKERLKTPKKEKDVQKRKRRLKTSHKD